MMQDNQKSSHSSAEQEMISDDGGETVALPIQHGVPVGDAGNDLEGGSELEQSGMMCMEGPPPESMRNVTVKRIGITKID